MLNKIIKYSLQRRMLVVFISTLILFGGIYTARDIDVDVFPDLTAPTVVIMTECHGMPPEEVEQLVTFRIETALNGSAGIRRLRSASSLGFSIVWAEFNWGTEIYKARQIVSEKLQTIQDQMPKTAGTPVLAPQSSIMGEIMLMSLQSDSLDKMKLRTLAEWTLRPQLLAINGVSQVVVMGGDFKQYQILLNPLKMKHYNITLDEVLEATDQMNSNSSGGFFDAHGNRYIIRGVIKTNEISELKNTVLKLNGKTPIKLSAIAEIKEESSPKIGNSTVNGEDAILITIKKQPDANTIKLTENIDKALLNIKKNLPAGVELNEHIFRQSDFIETSINNVTKALLEGGFFVVVVLFLFLTNGRTTFISLLAIPLSIIVTILTLKLLGLTINTMSLGGMAIAIGSLVDDAIIDVENVFKRLRQNNTLPKLERKANIDVIYLASVEIRASILNATLIIIAAFFPLFFLSGMEGRMLQPLGISFIVALFASLVVALTLTPALSYFLLTKESLLTKQEKDTRFVAWLKKHYEKTLTVALNYKKVIIFSSLALFGVAVLLMSNFGRSFLPVFNEGSLVITMITKPGIALEESNKLGVKAEKILLTIPEVKLTSRKTGRAELDEHSFGVNTSEIEVPFELDERSRETFLSDVREKLSQVQGANFTVGQPLSHRIDHILSGTSANIAIKLFGSDLNQMFSIANLIKSNIETIDGLVDIQVEQQVEIPQIQIKPKREMLAKYGIPIKTFSEFIDIAFAGEVIGNVFEENRSFDLVLRFGEKWRNDIESIKSTLISTADGSKIPLHYVATIASVSGPNTINRENVGRKLVIQANVSGRDIRTVVNEMKAIIGENIELPESYRLEYGGQFESEEEASSTIFYASLLSLLIIFLLLFSEFRSLKMASIIMLNLPLALIGGVFAIAITGFVLNIPALIGFITLFGIATRNGILLISRFKAMLADVKYIEMNLKDLIVEASIDRLNPILMTALTAALALIPLAVSGDTAGNEIQSPMAIVILGGLLTSTFLNIYVIPIIYLLSVRNDKSL